MRAAWSLVFFFGPTHAFGNTDVSCRAGRYLDHSSGSCQDCSPGQYSTKGSNSCYPCPPGTFSSKSGSGKCTTCSRGKFSLTGATSCSDCQVGFYSAKPSAGNCTACPADKTTDGPGAFACVPIPECSPGRTLKNAMCVKCESGYFKPSSGPQPCEPCPLGEKPEIGSQACSKCAVGQSTEHAGSGRCLPATGPYPNCPAGQQGVKFTNWISEKLTCEPCPPGFFKSSAGPEKCI